MTEANVRDALLSTPVPDELEAQRRAWAVVRAAYAEREPAPKRTQRLRLLVAVAAAAATRRSPPWSRCRVPDACSSFPSRARGS